MQLGGNRRWMPLQILYYSNGYWFRSLATS